MDKTLFLLLFVFLFGCAPTLQPRQITPANAVSRTLGGAAIGAAAGVAGGAVVGQPAAGAAAGGAAGGLLGLLSNIFSVTVVDPQGTYGGSGRMYDDPKDYCARRYEEARDRGQCEEGLRHGFENGRRQRDFYIKRDAEDAGRFFGEYGY